MSDSEFRRSLLGIWRLVSDHEDVGGTLVKPYGDNPQGYLVYTPDGHGFVQLITMAERPDVFDFSANGPALRETTEANTALGTSAISARLTSVMVKLFTIMNSESCRA